jgi:hypothetical protein
MPDALQSTSQSTPFDLFLPPRNMGETNEQPVETEVQTKGSAEAPMEAEEMPDKQCPPEVTFINEIREDPNNILNFRQEAQADLPLDRPLPRCSERTPAYTQAFLDWRRSLSKDGPNPDLNFGMEALSIANSIEPYEPHTLKEAMSSEQAELWKVAAEDE